MDDLDTTGTVYSVPGALARQGTIKPVDLDWCDLNAFTQGYISALFETSAHDLTAEGDAKGLPYREAFAFSDLAPETLARIIADCDDNTRNMIDHVSDDRKRHAGGQFWSMRQGARAGRFPPLTVQLGDEGKVIFQ